MTAHSCFLINKVVYRYDKVKHKCPQRHPSKKQPPEEITKQMRAKRGYIYNRYICRVKGPNKPSPPSKKYKSTISKLTNHLAYLHLLVRVYRRIASRCRARSASQVSTYSGSGSVRCSSAMTLCAGQTQHFRRREVVTKLTELNAIMAPAIIGRGGDRRARRGPWRAGFRARCTRTPRPGCVGSCRRSIARDLAPPRRREGPSA